MRTTVSLDDDIAAAIAQLRRERGIGLSEALNELARAGLTMKTKRKPFVQKTHPGRLLIDVTDIGQALEDLDGPSHR